MKVDIRSRSQAATRMVLLAYSFSRHCLLPSSAAAALGGDVSSVEADQHQMKAERTVQANAKYSVHEITTPYGTVVREYVSPGGTVFGVAWRGPFFPNLQQILGGDDGKFVQATQEAERAHPKRSRDLPLTVQQPDLVHALRRSHARLYRGRLRPRNDPAGR